MCDFDLCDFGYVRSVSVQYEGNFQNDSPQTRNVKVSAALLRMLTLVYDIWTYISKGYWDNPKIKPLVVSNSSKLNVSVVTIACCKTSRIICYEME